MTFYKSSHNDALDQWRETNGKYALTYFGGTYWSVWIWSISPQVQYWSSAELSTDRPRHWNYCFLICQKTVVEWGWVRKFLLPYIDAKWGCRALSEAPLFSFFSVRPSFCRQFVIRVDGCCTSCVVVLLFLPSGHMTRKQRHYDVRNDVITASCAGWVGL